MIPDCLTAPIPAAQAVRAAAAAAVPRLRTVRLALRAPATEDFPAFAEILCTDRGVHAGGPMPEEDAWLDFCQAGAGWLLRGIGMWTVTQRGDDAPLGFVILGNEWEDPGPEPELGFLFTAAAEGHGYAREAARAARDHGFALGIPAIVSYVAEENRRSIRLCEALGARHVGDQDGCRIYRHSRPEHPA